MPGTQLKSGAFGKAFYKCSEENEDVLADRGALLASFIP